MIRSWNPENCNLIVSWESATTGSVNSKILTNWNSVAFNFSDERWEYTTSTTGQITRSKIMNKLGTCEINAPEGSDVCEVLSLRINNNDKITVSLTDKSKTTGDSVTVLEFILSDGSVSNAGTGQRQRTAGERVFVITGEITKNDEKAYIN